MADGTDGATLDSSIPKHLRCPRTRHRRVSDTWKPPYPAFSAIVDPKVEQIVMAYYGVQAKGDAMKGPLCAAFQKIRDSLKLADGPARHDLVQFTDAEGYLNLIVVAYWQDPKTHQSWSNSPAVAGWWSSDDRLKEGVGYFREVLSPRMEQFETIFTHDYGPFEGVSILFGGGPRPEDWYGTLDAICAGRLDPLPCVGQVIGLDGVPGALETARRSEGPPRIVIHPNG